MSYGEIPAVLSMFFGLVILSMSGIFAGSVIGEMLVFVAFALLLLGGLVYVVA